LRDRVKPEKPTQVAEQEKERAQRTAKTRDLTWRWSAGSDTRSEPCRIERCRPGTFTNNRILESLSSASCLFLLCVLLRWLFGFAGEAQKEKPGDVLPGQGEET
jgi:hypothetical protein